MIDIVPWGPRPRSEIGDDNAQNIFCAVGVAMTLWETIEGSISIAYIGMIANKKYYEDRYFRTNSFKARHQMVMNVLAKNLSYERYDEFCGLMEEVQKFSVRRNEIAHGRVYNLGEYGYYLGPNNTMARHFPDGKAIYQYTSTDIIHYAQHFDRLGRAMEPHSKRLGLK